VSPTCLSCGLRSPCAGHLCRMPEALFAEVLATVFFHLAFLHTLQQLVRPMETVNQSRC